MKSICISLNVDHRVEVKRGSGWSIGSWNTGTIKGLGDNVCNVEYDHIFDQSSKKLVESIPIDSEIDDTKQDQYRVIRLAPPSQFVSRWDVHYGFCVDAYIKEAWWEGVVFDREDGFEERLIFFPDSGDEKKFKVKDLRTTQDWDEGSQYWTTRSKWLFLELLDQHKQDWSKIFTVSQIWNNVRATEEFEKEIVDWYRGCKMTWEKLVMEVIRGVKAVADETEAGRNEVEYGTQELLSADRIHDSLPHKSAEWYDRFLMEDNNVWKNIVAHVSDLGPKSRSVPESGVAGDAFDTKVPHTDADTVIVADDLGSGCGNTLRRGDNERAEPEDLQHRFSDKDLGYEDGNVGKEIEALDLEVGSKDIESGSDNMFANKGNYEMARYDRSGEDDLVSKPQELQLISSNGNLFAPTSFGEDNNVGNEVVDYESGSGNTKQLRRMVNGNWMNIHPGAKRCPEAVIDYLATGSFLSKLKDSDGRSKAEKARMHLSYLGWIVQLKEDVSDLKSPPKFRYISPDGKCNYSLTEACKYSITSQSSQNRVQVSVGVQGKKLTSNVMQRASSEMPKKLQLQWETKDEESKQKTSLEMCKQLQWKFPETPKQLQPGIRDEASKEKTSSEMSQQLQGGFLGFSHMPKKLQLGIRDDESKQKTPTEMFKQLQFGFSGFSQVPKQLEVGIRDDESKKKTSSEMCNQLQLGFTGFSEMPKQLQGGFSDDESKQKTSSEMSKKPQLGFARFSEMPKQLLGVIRDDESKRKASSDIYKQPQCGLRDEESKEKTSSEMSKQLQCGIRCEESEQKASPEMSKQLQWVIRGEEYSCEGKSFISDSDDGSDSESLGSGSSQSDGSSDSDNECGYGSDRGSPVLDTPEREVDLMNAYTMCVQTPLSDIPDSEVEHTGYTSSLCGHNPVLDIAEGGQHRTYSSSLCVQTPALEHPRRKRQPKNIDHADDVEKITPVYCPQAVIEYSKIGSERSKKNEFIKELRRRAIQHLRVLGWTFWKKTKKSGYKEWRYTSPSGKTQISVAKACQACVAEGSVFGQKRLTNGVVGGNLLQFPGKLFDGKMGNEGERRIFLKTGQPQNIQSESSGSSKLGKLHELRKTFAVASTREKRSRKLLDYTDDYQEPKRHKTSRDPVRGDNKIVSNLIDSGVVFPDQKVYYISRKDGSQMGEGRIAREGIKCNCCQKVITMTMFESHSGSTLHRPSANIFLEDGRSLMECQMQIPTENKVKRFKAEDPKINKRNQPRNKNDDECSICHYGGNLVLCDHCPSAFHLSCLDLEGLPEGKWFCPCCRCSICEQSDFDGDAEQFTEKTYLYCDQCECGYHVGCIREKRQIKLETCPKGNWFCSENCEQIYSGLHELLGKPLPVGADNLTCTILKPLSHDNHGNEDVTTTEHQSKLKLALDVMHECFDPIEDPFSKRDIVEDVLFNRRSGLNRLNFSGFYTMILERHDELISLATVRVHGEKVAELPFIVTRLQYRGQGMCRLLMEVVEKKLVELGVQRLVLPAVPQTVHTWNKSFGFSAMTKSERLELLKYTFLDFKETAMCHKFLSVPRANKLEPIGLWHALGIKEKSDKDLNPVESEVVQTLHN